MAKRHFFRGTQSSCNGNQESVISSDHFRFISREQENTPFVSKKSLSGSKSKLEAVVHHHLSLSVSSKCDSQTISHSSCFFPASLVVAFTTSSPTKDDDERSINRTPPPRRGGTPLVLLQLLLIIIIITSTTSARFCTMNNTSSRPALLLLEPPAPLLIKRRSA